MLSTRLLLLMCVCVCRCVQIIGVSTGAVYWSCPNVNHGNALLEDNLECVRA